MAAQEAAPPVFTAAQADAGKLAYAKNCASCHMPDLSGDNERAPLTGPGFMTTWGDKSTKEFLRYLSGTMPYGAPALDEESYLALTAFILKSNGARAGEVAFDKTTDVPIARTIGPP